MSDPNSPTQALEALRDQVRALRAMEAIEAIVPELGYVIEAELKRTANAGTTPDGEQWKPTIEGNPPLANAARAIAVVSEGNKVYVTIRGPEARHHLGAGRGRVKREIIYTSENDLPETLLERMRAVVARVFEERFGNG